MKAAISKGKALEVLGGTGLQGGLIGAGEVRENGRC